MAAITRAKDVSPKTHRMSVKDYLKMIVAGVIPHDAHMELLDGTLVEQMTKYAPHHQAVSESVELFRQSICRWPG